MSVVTDFIKCYRNNAYKAKVLDKNLYVCGIDYSESILNVCPYAGECRTLAVKNNTGQYKLVEAVLCKYFEDKKKDDKS